MLREQPPSRRTILLAYNTITNINSQQLYEWSLSNILRPNLDHVNLVSVVHVPKLFFPMSDHVWTNGSEYYSDAKDTTTSDNEYDEYQTHIRNEKDYIKRRLQKIAQELIAKNVS